MNINNKINNLKEEGKTIKEVSNILKIPYSTTCYHYSEDRKEKAKSYQANYQKEHPPKRGKKYRDYQRDYHKKRYWRLKEEKK